MATTRSKAFVDTNILIRATIAAAPLHQEAVDLIFAQRRSGAELWISRQVIREYLANLTRTQAFIMALPIDQLERRIFTFGRLFQIADDTAQVTSQLLSL